MWLQKLDISKKNEVQLLNHYRLLAKVLEYEFIELSLLDCYRVRTMFAGVIIGILSRLPRYQGSCKVFKSPLWEPSQILERKKIWQSAEYKFIMIKTEVDSHLEDILFIQTSCRQNLLIRIHTYVNSQKS